MGFRRVSYLKVYAIFCTAFIFYLLTSEWENEGSILRQNRKLHKEIKKLKKGCTSRASSHDSEDSVEPEPIYLITPTYARLTQKADMTRLMYTLMHVENLHWIIIEDHDEKTQLITKFIEQISTEIQVTHLNAKTPPMDKLSSEDPNWLKPRGVQQRNAGLEYLLEHFGKNTEGYIYFLDDDNTYDIRIFEEIRKIEQDKVGVWPVGIVGKLRYEGPVCSNGEVISWFTAWKPDRPFPLDMAGFSFRLENLFEAPEARFKQRVPRGYQESHILTELGLDRKNAVGLANDCREILVWHTRTEKPRMDAEEKLMKATGAASDLSIEV